jgi:NADPH2:quinone reductase
MKAIVISRLGGPEVLEVRDVPDPVVGPEQELVRVQAGGLNFADFMTAQGGYPGTPKPPLIAGREFCGARESDGRLVMGYTQWAAFAERVAARAELLWPVPANWTAEEGAAFPVNYFTGVLCLLESWTHRSGETGCWRCSASSDSRSRRRRGNGGGADRKVARCGNVWDIVF